jgi:hypothetical protein
VSYTGASFGSRTATLRDPNLRNPYIINWSAGFQGQLSDTWTVSLMHQGTSGVGLIRSWNINTIPLSIALGSDRALQDKVFAAQQSYLYYPQFGAINYLSNFNHNTWHSGNVTVDKRYGKGLTLQVSYNISKSLSRTEEKRRTLRAAFLLDSLSGQSDEAIAQRHHVSRSTVVLCIQKFLSIRSGPQWRATG